MSSPAHDPDAPATLRAVALLELLKGAIVLAAGFGMLGLVHRDVRRLALALVTRLHIDPERHFAGVFVEAAARLNDSRLWTLAALALAYSALRFVEAYGLWRGRNWALWLGAGGGAIYLPIEAYELWTRPSTIRVATLCANLAVVLYLLWSLWRRRQEPPRPAAT